jgi:hypothetical protein
MRIVSFDGVTFGRQNEQDGISFDMATSQTKIPGADGAFDNHGDNQYREPFTFSRSFLLTGTAIHTDLDTLLSKTNRRGWLVMQTGGTVNRGCWAKLTNVSYDNTPEQVNYLPVKLSFMVANPWLEAEDDVWYLDAGKELDDSLLFDGNYTTRALAGTFPIANAGGGAITRGIIEVRGSATNPTITNSTNGWSIAYAGTVASGSTLVIDIGAQSVTLAGVDNWANVTLGANQTGLMRLEIGTNTIVYTGGGILVWHWAKVY